MADSGKRFAYVGSFGWLERRVAGAEDFTPQKSQKVISNDILAGSDSANGIHFNCIAIFRAAAYINKKKGKG